MDVAPQEKTVLLCVDGSKHVLDLFCCYYPPEPLKHLGMNGMKNIFRRERFSPSMKNKDIAVKQFKFNLLIHVCT